MKAPKEEHERLDAMYSKAWDEGREDGLSDGYNEVVDMRHDVGENRLKATAATDLLARLTDALGWHRLDVERFRETGELPKGKP